MLRCGVFQNRVAWSYIYYYGLLRSFNGTGTGTNTGGRRTIGGEGGDDEDWKRPKTEVEVKNGKRGEVK